MELVNVGLYYNTGTRLVVYSVITELLLKPATTVSKKTSYSQVDCVMSV